MTTTTRTYHAVGDVRGSCGHHHQTEGAVERCAGRDSDACARLPGRRSDSDRVVRAYDGDPTPSEQNIAVCAAETDAAYRQLAAAERQLAEHPHDVAVQANVDDLRRWAREADAAEYGAREIS